MHHTKRPAVRLQRSADNSLVDPRPQQLVNPANHDNSQHTATWRRHDPYAAAPGAAFNNFTPLTGSWADACDDGVTDNDYCGTSTASLGSTPTLARSRSVMSNVSTTGSSQSQDRSTVIRSFAAVTSSSPCYAAEKKPEPVQQDVPWTQKRICRHHIVGRCTRGDLCRFSHDLTAPVTYSAADATPDDARRITTARAFLCERHKCIGVGQQLVIAPRRPSMRSEHAPNMV